MVGILLLLSYNAVCLFLTSESKQPVSSNFDEFVRTEQITSKRLIDWLAGDSGFFFLNRLLNNLDLAL